MSPSHRYASDFELVTEGLVGHRGLVLQLPRLPEDEPLRQVGVGLAPLAQVGVDLVGGPALHALAGQKAQGQAHDGGREVTVTKSLRSIHIK